MRAACGYILEGGLYFARVANYPCWELSGWDSMYVCKCMDGWMDGWRPRMGGGAWMEGRMDRWMAGGARLRQRSCIVRRDYLMRIMQATYRTGQQERNGIK